MQEIRVGKEMDWLPDEPYYKLLIDKAILYKAAVRIVRQEQFPAYRANIVSYLIAYISSRTGGQLDMELIWQEQGLSREFEELLRSWSHKIEEAIRSTAEGRNVDGMVQEGGLLEIHPYYDLSVVGSNPA